MLDDDDLPLPPLEMEYAHNLLCALLSNPATDTTDPDLALRAAFHAQRLIAAYPVPQELTHGSIRSDH